MAIDRYQTGRLMTAVKVNLTYKNILDSWGSWYKEPMQEVDAGIGLNIIFECVNRASYACGPRGIVKYKSQDGSEFTIEFDCPTSSPNICNVSVSAGSPWTITGDVPAHGVDIDYTCKIFQKAYNAVIDVPVSVIDILNAPKCNMIPESKIVEYADGREKVCLKDVFEIKDLPPEAKLWCAGNPLFLTDQGKAALSRRFVQEIVSEYQTDSFNVQRLIDDALIFNDNVARGEFSQSKRESVCGALADKRRENISEAESEILSMIYSLLTPNLSEGWSLLQHLYVKRYVAEGLSERQKTMLAFIEKNL